MFILKEIEKRATRELERILAEARASDRLLQVVVDPEKHGLPGELRMLYIAERSHFSRLEKEHGWKTHAELDATESTLFRAELFRRYLGNRSLNHQRRARAIPLIDQGALSRRRFNHYQSRIEELDVISDAVYRLEELTLSERSVELGIDNLSLFSAWKRKIELHANMVHARSLDEEGNYKEASEEVALPSREECQGCQEIIEGRNAFLSVAKTK